MCKVKLLFRGQEISLWEFAQIWMDKSGGMHSDNTYQKVIFDDKVRKGKLITLCEALNDLEFFVGQIFEELDPKSNLKRWFNLKIFGTFEQLRTEMELRYPQAETIFLRTHDHKRIHCYWVPGRTIEG